MRRPRPHRMRLAWLRARLTLAAPAEAAPTAAEMSYMRDCRLARARRPWKGFEAAQLVSSFGHRRRLRRLLLVLLLLPELIQPHAQILDCTLRLLRTLERSLVYDFASLSTARARARAAESWLARFCLSEAYSASSRLSTRSAMPASRAFSASIFFSAFLLPSPLPPPSPPP